MAKGSGNAPQHLQKIGAEVSDHRRDTAQLNRCGDRYAGITPTQQHRHNLEMGSAADGKKLRQPLNDAQHQIAPASLNKAERSGRFRHE